MYGSAVSTSGGAAETDSAVAGIASVLSCTPTEGDGTWLGDIGTEGSLLDAARGAAATSGDGSERGIMLKAHVKFELLFTSPRIAIQYHERRPKLPSSRWFLVNLLRVISFLRRWVTRLAASVHK